jgi:hypothetical protein
MTDMRRRPGADRGDVDDLLAGGVGADDNGPVMRLWQQAVAASKRESQARRGRVLVHGDLAQQLKQSPLRLTEPSRWSGWIPPKTLAEEACSHCERDTPRPICRGLPHRARVNDSPVRRQLVAIATEAMAREPGRR